jgi:DNA (cytosine-5)-methyltransferase 1
MIYGLDLYCAQGGMTKGFQDLGIRILGVDLQEQPRYCGERFVQADALEYLRGLIAFGPGLFSFVHASPPCQHDSDCQRIRGREHPDLIGPTRELLAELGLPYIIENVRGALPKLHDPVMLCGTMFGLRTYRHRYFETSFPLAQPEHPEHVAPQAKMGRPPREEEFIQAVGNFSGVQRYREDTGQEWMNRDGLRESIPPAYARYVGGALLDHLGLRVAA